MNMATQKTATEELAEMEAIAKAAKAETEAAEAKAAEKKAEAEKRAAEAVAKPTKVQGINGVYYLVNPGGAIHGVDREHARWRLASPGWRLATEDEITVYKGQAIQRADRPICTPWSPDPDKQLAELE